MIYIYYYDMIILLCLFLFFLVSKHVRYALSLTMGQSCLIARIEEKFLFVFSKKSKKERK